MTTLSTLVGSPVLSRIGNGVYHPYTDLLPDLLVSFFLKCSSIPLLPYVPPEIDYDPVKCFPLSFVEFDPAFSPIPVN